MGRQYWSLRLGGLPWGWASLAVEVVLAMSDFCAAEARSCGASRVERRIAEF